jgi:hypothetical protein
MHSCGELDWIVLATVAIEALTVEDLRDLMPAKAARTAAPAAVARMTKPTVINVFFKSGQRQLIACVSHDDAARVFTEIAAFMVEGLPVISIEDWRLPSARSRACRSAIRCRRSGWSSGRRPQPQRERPAPWGEKPALIAN